MNEMTATEAMEFLADETVGHLAVVDGEEPYVSPISYVVKDGTLFFRSRPGRRLRALQAHPRLCIEVSIVDDEANTWTSVCVWGDAEIVTDPNVDAEVVAMLLAKYADASEAVLSFASGPDLGEQTAVVSIAVDTITGRRSGKEFGVHIRPGRL